MAGLQGRTLGGYQLTEQIASAGIAEVYRARPLAANGREVVIKVIYPEFARYPGFLPNFQQIIQTAARLASHPHILPVVASGEENGYLYLATPWVADGTLRDLIMRGGRLGASDAGPFFHQLCSALAYAHSLGLAHGNLKPSNVFLYEGRHIMLGDFGMLWDIRQLDMNHSGSGTDVVEYLAPESFSGQFTQQSDIYSLGAILFATLTGRPPFSAAKPADLRDAHMNYPPPRLGQVDPSLPPGVQALDPVIQQAMAKRPGDRFSSAMALAQAIDTTLKQQPAAPPMPAMRALPPAPAMGQPMAQPMGPQPGPKPPGAPGSWADPGPIQPAPPPVGPGGQPVPGVAAMRPFDPAFPPFNGASNNGAPGAQQAENIQYTERVPAPPVARPLISRPQLPAPAASPPGGPDPWAPQSPYAPNMPGMPMTDDPDWRQDQWPQENGSAEAYGNDFARPDGPPRRLAARDDDWRLSRNAPSQQSSLNYPSGFSEYTDQRVALPDDSFGMSRDDWASQSQSGQHSQALRYRGGFSATELGLPRLTNPALQGELPPEWEDLLADEMLPSRADLYAGPSRRAPAPRRSQADDYGYSSAGQPYAPGGPGPRPARQREQPAPSRAGGSRGQPMPTLASAYQPAYTASRAPAPPRATSERSFERNDELDDEGAQGKRRWPTIVLLVALVLTLVSSAGVVLAKPTLCPGAFCVQANNYLHRHLSFLGPASNANVLEVTPAALTIQATTGSTTNLSVQVSNSGTDTAVWHATTNVGWLTITPSSGTIAPGASETLSIAVSPVDIKPGSYSAQVKVETPDTSVNIPVTASIAIGPKLQLPASPLNVTQCGVPQSVKIGNTGDNALSFSSTPSSATLLQISSPSSSVNPGSSVTLAVTINCAAPIADYTISISSNGGNGTITIHYT